MPKQTATLTKRRGYWYGKSQADLRQEIIRFSLENAYPATAFADAVCTCGSTRFALSTDEDEGVAVRFCLGCTREHVMADGEDFMEDARPEPHECLCGAAAFELTVGISLYEDSEDVRWLYVGARCVACELVGVFADWKNEFNGYQALLAKV